ncbi:MAG: glycosyltransferase family 10 domain-containing protein [Methylobacter sp.]
MTPCLYGVGFTFDPLLSSCSKHQPKLFRWTADAHEENMGCEVFIGETILAGIRTVTTRRKFAWFIESREIHRGLWDIIIRRLREIDESFEIFFTCDQELAGKLKNSILISSGSNLPWTEPGDPRLLIKSKLCSMICSPKQATEGHRLRHEWAYRLSNKIDIFGGAMNTPRLGNGIHPSKAGALNEYMFHIVIENASYSSYYTEKITDCFITGVIPVYYGDPSIGSVFNEDGIIWLNDDFDLNSLTADLYQIKHEAIVDNFERTCLLWSADDELFLHISNSF